MTSNHQMAAHLVILKILILCISDAQKAVECEIRDTWRVGDRNAAELPDGQLLGFLTLANGRNSARLVNEGDYQAWVERTHPDEIETVTITRVRPAFTARTRAYAKQVGEPIDSATGEVIPGLQVTEGDPYPTTTTTLVDNAAELVAQAWQAGQLAELAALIRPAIEGGGQ